MCIDVIDVPEIIVCNNVDSGCPWEGTLQSADDHMLKDCDYQPMACSLETLGCHYNNVRKNLRKHEEENKEEHFYQVMLAALDLNQLDNTLKTGKHKIIKLSKFMKLRENKVEFRSDPFYTPLGYKLEFQVSTYGQGSGCGSHLSVFINIMNSPSAIELKEPFDGEVVVELLNHLLDRDHHQKVIVFDAAEGIRSTGSCGYNKFIAVSDLGRNRVKYVEYLRFDVLCFRITLRSHLYRHWLYSD